VLVGDEDVVNEGEAESAELGVEDDGSVVGWEASDEFGREAEDEEGPEDGVRESWGIDAETAGDDAVDGLGTDGPESEELEGSWRLRNQCRFSSVS